MLNAPNITELQQDPVLGEALGMLQQGQTAAFVGYILEDLLPRAPLAELQAGHRAARTVLTALMYDGEADRQLIAHVDLLVSAALDELRARGLELGRQEA